MYEVSVDESFAAAHNLRNYKGKCEDLHGHNYKVRVTLAGAELDATGLLYDFVHLKQVIQGVIRSLDFKIFLRGPWCSLKFQRPVCDPPGPGLCGALDRRAA